MTMTLLRRRMDSNILYRDVNNEGMKMVVRRMQSDSTYNGQTSSIGTGAMFSSPFVKIISLERAVIK